MLSIHYPSLAICFVGCIITFVPLFCHLELNKRFNDMEQIIPERGTSSPQFQNAVISSISVTIPSIMDFLIDFWSANRSFSDIISLLSLILSTSIPCVILLLHAIPNGNYQLVPLILSIRSLILMYCGLSFLSSFGLSVWTHRRVSLMTALLTSCHIFFAFELFTEDSTSHTMALLKALSAFIGIVIGIVQGFFWMKHMRYFQIKYFYNLKDDDKSCTVHILLLIGFIIIQSVLNPDFVDFAFTDTQDAGYATTRLYIQTAYAVIASVMNSRFIRREILLSNSKRELEWKRTLVGYFSHEIRTPLNSISMGLQIMKRRLRDMGYLGEPLIQTSKELQASCDSAVDILNDLLTYEKLESNNITLIKTSTKIRPTMETILSPFRLQAEQKGVILKVEFSKALVKNWIEVMVDVDEGKFGRVIRNLVTNAIECSLAHYQQKLQILAAAHKIGSINQGDSINFNNNNTTITSSTNTNNNNNNSSTISRSVIETALMLPSSAANSVRGIGGNSQTQNPIQNQNTNANVNVNTNTNASQPSNNINTVVVAVEPVSIRKKRRMSTQKSVAIVESIESNNDILDFDQEVGTDGEEDETIHKSVEQMIKSYNPSFKNYNMNIEESKMTSKDDFATGGSTRGSLLVPQSSNKIILKEKSIKGILKDTTTTSPQQGLQSKTERNVEQKADNPEPSDGLSFVTPIVILPEIEKPKVHISVKIIPANTLNSTNFFDQSKLNYSSENEMLYAVQIMFKDSGPGLSKEDQDKLFKDAISFTAGVLQAREGMGLGLWISRKYMCLHQGDLSVYSDGEGRGSTFTVTIPTLYTPPEGNDNFKGKKALRFLSQSLPKSTRQKNPIPKRNSKGRGSILGFGGMGKRSSSHSSLKRVGSWSEGRVVPGVSDRQNSFSVTRRSTIMNTNTNSNIGNTPQQTRRKSSLQIPFVDLAAIVEPLVRDENGQPFNNIEEKETEAPRRVLIVDDAPMNLKMLCRLLESYCDEIVTGSDGLEGLKRMKKSIDNGCVFDLVLMDYQMPTMDGPTSAKEMRALGYKGPLIGVTGNVLPQHYDTYIANGADRVLEKPLNFNELRRCLADMGKDQILQRKKAKESKAP